MTQPNDELIEKIEKELEEVRDNELVIDAYGNIIVKSNGTLIASVHNLYYYEVLTKSIEWLRALLEERERLTYFNDHYKQDAELMKGQRDHLREELEQLREDRHQNAADLFHDLNTELEQVKAELAAKDKVLEWYAGEQYGKVFFSPPIPDIPILHDCGEQARTILSQYKGEDKG